MNWKEEHLAKRIQVAFEGKLVPAEQLSFEAEAEPWTVYTLEDGSVLKVRNVLGSVTRVIGQYKPNGEPIYVLGLGTIPIMEIPGELHQLPPTQDPSPIKG